MVNKLLVCIVATMGVLVLAMVLLLSFPFWPAMLQKPFAGWLLKPLPAEWEHAEIRWDSLILEDVRLGDAWTSERVSTDIGFVEVLRGFPLPSKAEAWSLSLSGVTLDLGEDAGRSMLGDFSGEISRESVIGLEAVPVVISEGVLAGEGTLAVSRERLSLAVAFREPMIYDAYRWASWRAEWGYDGARAKVALSGKTEPLFFERKGVVYQLPGGLPAALAPVHPVGGALKTGPGAKLEVSASDTQLLQFELREGATPGGLMSLLETVERAEFSRYPFYLEDVFLELMGIVKNTRDLEVENLVALVDGREVPLSVVDLDWSEPQALVRVLSPEQEAEASEPAANPEDSAAKSASPETTQETAAATKPEPTQKAAAETKSPASPPEVTQAAEVAAKETEAEKSPSIAKKADESESTPLTATEEPMEDALASISPVVESEKTLQEDNSSAPVTEAAKEMPPVEKEAVMTQTVPEPDNTQDQQEVAPVATTSVGSEGISATSVEPEPTVASQDEEPEEERPESPVAAFLRKASQYLERLPPEARAQAFPIEVDTFSIEGFRLQGMEGMLSKVEKGWTIAPFSARVGSLQLSGRELHLGSEGTLREPGATGTIEISTLQETFNTPVATRFQMRSGALWLSMLGAGGNLDYSFGGESKRTPFRVLFVEITVGSGNDWQVRGFRLTGSSLRVSGSGKVIFRDGEALLRLKGTLVGEGRERAVLIEGPLTDIRIEPAEGASSVLDDVETGP